MSCFRRDGLDTRTVLVSVFLFISGSLWAQIPWDQPIPNSYVYYVDTRGDEPVLTGLLFLRNDQYYYRVVWPRRGRQIAAHATIEPGLTTHVEVLDRLVSGSEDELWNDGQRRVEEIFNTAALRSMQSDVQLPESLLIAKSDLDGRLQATVSVRHWVPVTYLYSIEPVEGRGSLRVYHFGVIFGQEDLAFFFEVLETPGWTEDLHEYSELPVQALRPVQIGRIEIALDRFAWEERRPDAQNVYLSRAGVTPRDAAIRVFPVPAEEIAGTQAFWNYFRHRLLISAAYIPPESVRVVGARDDPHMEYVVMDPDGGVLSRVVMVPHVGSDGSATMVELSTYEKNYQENRAYFGEILSSIR